MALVPPKPSFNSAVQLTSDWLKNFISALINDWQRLTYVINSHITFGNPTVNIVTQPQGKGNIDGAWASVLTPNTANTEFSFAHNLNRVPVGFIVVSIDQAGIVYNSTTTWTTTSIYLKCNVASANIVIFII